MTTFDTAFDRAFSKGKPAEGAPRREEMLKTPLEDIFETRDHFDYDPTRLVVSTTVVGEQYRTLKTNLGRLCETEGLTSAVFSSSLKGEGKTTVAVNTAREFARERKAKIAVVDCDFKRPGLGRFCGVEPSAGIEDALSGQAPLAECGIYSRRDNFAVFPVKSRPRETGEILTADAIRRLLGELEHIFDLVLFDTSPVLSTSEPLVLGARTGGVVLVVRAGTTQRESVLYSQGQLEQAGCRLLGLVLNARASYVPRLWLLRRYDYFADYYRYKAS